MLAITYAGRCWLMQLWANSDVVGRLQAVQVILWCLDEMEYLANGYRIGTERAVALRYT